MVKGLLASLMMLPQYLKGRNKEVVILSFLVNSVFSFLLRYFHFSFRHFIYLYVHTYAYIHTHICSYICILYIILKISFCTQTCTHTHSQLTGVSAKMPCFCQRGFPNRFHRNKIIKTNLIFLSAIYLLSYLLSYLFCWEFLNLVIRERMSNEQIAYGTNQINKDVGIQKKSLKCSYFKLLVSLGILFCFTSFQKSTGGLQRVCEPL